LLAWIATGAISQAAPPADDHASSLPPEAELLALYGMDAKRLAEFNDGRPVAEDELDPLLRMLVAARRFTLGELKQWQHSDLPDAANLKDTRDDRGQIYRFAGRVKQVAIERLPAELAARFQLDHYYRCQLEAADKRPLVVYALDVPRAWKPGTALDQPAAACGFLLKRTAKAEPAADATPAFAAQRVEFYPPDLLGQLGMDVGLLDDVADRKPIEAGDRVCFYSLLAAAKRSQPGALLRQAASHDPIVPLFNQPEEQRGRLIGTTGTAIRAIPIVVEDREMLDVFGIDHYYEVEVVNPDSQGNALVFCVLELPPGMPSGERIVADVRAAGFYFKSWAYHPHPLANKGLPAGEIKLRLSPLLIGRELALVVKPATSNWLIDSISVGLLLAAILGLMLLAWWFRREDRRYRRKALAGDEQPISLPPEE
jgi:hypothetical protein